MNCSAQSPGLTQESLSPPRSHTPFFSDYLDECQFVFPLVKSQSRIPSGGGGERDGPSPPQPGLSLPEAFLLLPFPPGVPGYFWKPHTRSTAGALLSPSTGPPICKQPRWLARELAAPPISSCFCSCAFLTERLRALTCLGIQCAWMAWVFLAHAACTPSPSSHHLPPVDISHSVSRC